MVTVAIIATRLLKENGIVPDYVAGLEFSEYSALNAAGGVLTDNDAIDLVRFRGQDMKELQQEIKVKCLQLLV